MTASCLSSSDRRWSAEWLKTLQPWRRCNHSPDNPGERRSRCCHLAGVHTLWYLARCITAMIAFATITVSTAINKLLAVQNRREHTYGRFGSSSSRSNRLRALQQQERHIRPAHHPRTSFQFGRRYSYEPKDALDYRGTCNHVQHRRRCTRNPTDWSHIQQAIIERHHARRNASTRSGIFAPYGNFVWG
jgi:hypothetical protein